MMAKKDVIVRIGTILRDLGISKRYEEDMIPYYEKNQRDSIDRDMLDQLRDEHEQTLADIEFYSSIIELLTL